MDPHPSDFPSFLASILSNQQASYAIIEKDSHITVAYGVPRRLHNTHQLRSLVQSQQAESDLPIVAAVPFAQAREAGLRARGDDFICAIAPTGSFKTTLAEALVHLQDDGSSTSLDVEPTISDEDFEQLVAHAIKEHIGGGAVCQLVLSRVFETQFAQRPEPISPGRQREPAITHAQALVLFRRLLLSGRFKECASSNQGSYFTFLFHFGEFFLCGASPERHVTVDGHRVWMNPIAGTMPKVAPGDQWPHGPLTEECLTSYEHRLGDFIGDGKETDELAMVVDEELKMIVAIACGSTSSFTKQSVASRPMWPPVSVTGPHLREAGSVVHTEYLLYSFCPQPVDCLEALTLSFWAPTLVGSPLESAFKLIEEEESVSRGYYGGCLCVINSLHHMDSAILIRTCYGDVRSGELRVQAGAGLVRDSVPSREAAETRHKADGAISSLLGRAPPRPHLLSYLPLDRFQSLQSKLQSRNLPLSAFWMHGTAEPVPELDGVRLTIVDNEDLFVRMLAIFAASMGMTVRIISSLEAVSIAPGLKRDGSDVLLMGPGPGDVNDPVDYRMVRAIDTCNFCMKSRIPLVGVCLGIQAISKALGERVPRSAKPCQGMQRTIDYFGRPERVAFYCSYAPAIETQDVQSEFELSTGEPCPGAAKTATFAMRSRTRPISACLFHPESVLTERGYDVRVVPFLDSSPYLPML